jgi:stage II sporulation protein D
MPLKRVLAIFISLLVSFYLLGIGGGRRAEAATDYSIVKVALTSMGAPKSVTVKVEGNYSIPEKTDLSVQAGKSYTIKVESGRLYWVDGTTKTAMGSSFTLKRHQGPETKGLVINSKCYLGDMVVRLNSGSIQLINHVFLETYLYGVVPHEMGNGKSWPMEALKAQAVAARSYAVYKIKYNASSPFHMEDTTSSQVYRGYNGDYKRAIDAVNQTAKMVLMYGNNFVEATYYASNGGQTELPTNVGWSKRGYFVMKDDPYDLANPSSLEEKTTIPKVNNGEMNSKLETFLKELLKSTLEEKGYSSTPKDIIIKEVLALDLSTSFPPPSRRMTDGSISLSLEVKKKAKDGSVSATAEPLQVDNLKFKVSALKTALGWKTRLFSVEEDKEKDSFVLYGRGWGHGVGMSQRGAQYAAGQESMKYNDILNFYYPGTKFATISIKEPQLTKKPSLGGDNDRPKPTPTPTPTPKPSTSMGEVKVNTSLNVRKGAGTNYAVIGSLKNGAKVEILEKGSTWYKIKYGSGTGYVHKQYIKILSSTPTNPSNPPKNDPPTHATPPQDKYGRVTASKLNVRTGAGTKNKRVGYVYKGNRVKILATSGAWYKISYGNLTGYAIAITSNWRIPAPPPVNRQRPHLHLVSRES